MSKEYYVIENKSNLGGLNIGNAVFQSIVVQVISEIDGVDFDGNMNRALEVEINDNNQVIIGVDLAIRYGLNVGKTVSTLQNKILETISQMIGFKNVRINANVDKIVF